MQDLPSQCLQRGGGQGFAPHPRKYGPCRCLAKYCAAKLCQMLQYYAFLREADLLQNGWIFVKFQKGGWEGVIFNPKIYIADFCHCRRYFSHEFRKKKNCNMIIIMITSGSGNSSTFLPIGATEWERGPDLPVRSIPWQKIQKSLIWYLLTGKCKSLNSRVQSSRVEINSNSQISGCSMGAVLRFQIINC